MSRGFGVVGFWCVQKCCEHGMQLCEHNLRDASVSPQNVCTGYSGDCNQGEKFTCSKNHYRGDKTEEGVA